MVPAFRDDDVCFRRFLRMEREHQPAHVGGRQFLSHPHAHLIGTLKVRYDLDAPRALVNDESELITSTRVTINLREIDMAKGEQRSNRETKKPKKEKIKVIAAGAEPKERGLAADLGYRQKEIMWTPLGGAALISLLASRAPGLSGPAGPSAGRRPRTASHL